jgi:hypothetical protein
MRYSFRLAEVVNHVPDPRRRPGTIKAICDYTGLDRHQVAALLKNEVKYVPLDALSKLCGYLIDRGFAKASELPGRLFGIVPEHFWELLARRNGWSCAWACGAADNSLDDAWVVASDSVLLGKCSTGRRHSRHPGTHQWLRRRYAAALVQLTASNSSPDADGPDQATVENVSGWLRAQ